MASNDAITEWIDQLKDGDSMAADRLWRQYFEHIVRLARTRLEGAKRSVADEEDIALSAFNSVCLGAREGRFPRLSDRDSLWSLLMAITAHKSVDMVRRENRQKRGGAGGVADAGSRRDEKKVASLSQMIERTPTPELASEMEELFSLLMERLESAHDPDLLHIANAKMIGQSNDEVAQELGCVRRTVERKIRVIRQLWERGIMK